jgi:hypothetical protein
MWSLWQGLKILLRSYADVKQLQPYPQYVDVHHTTLERFKEMRRAVLQEIANLRKECR